MDMLITETVIAGIGLFIFISYIVFSICLNKWRIPESISATSYIFKERFNVTWPFILLCVISSLFLFPLWVTVSPVTWQFLVFLSCAGILFAGSTPLYREEFEGKIHYAGGITAFISGLLWLSFTSNWYSLIIIALIGGLITIFSKKNYVFIFEVISYITICFTVFGI